jgi:hypothetical protein
MESVTSDLLPLINFHVSNFQIFFSQENTTIGELGGTYVY